MPKLICVVGVTGNQGGSVAERFSKDPDYRVRGLTRNPDSPVAQKLAARGIEIVKADLDDVNTLIPAFAGANVIFSVTNYWEPFFRPDCRQRAAESSISCRKYAYDVEYQQGKNIADAAAATVDTLDENGFLVSTLSHAGKCSQGKFDELYHFDSKADIFPGYVNEKYPNLAKKMSCVQTGFFNSSYKLVPEAYFQKMPDGTFKMCFPTTPDAKIPHLAVNEDLGNFVYAVSKMPAGRAYMAAGSICSWSEYMRIWSQVTGLKSSYEQVTIEQIIKSTPDKEFGREVGDMFAYSSDPGYDGGDDSLLKAEDLRAAGIDCPMTTLEQWMRKEDWSPVLAA
ncbi:conserved hypothetical protein [Uncinocarpus reesii 1704]|uniref:NmrA-like domain-containing protein n=1 Tax=Uncinocarpus reesii (strain UAMH 1704) TaxID=336963 RepID=C4JET5_UNCRE|nr:uncharacterized protein UREG_02245 [Uncinocarpus reesii 1704]EEP77396.1 conserved hypothetical protein [Uncinocarpus reesii 1704]